MTVPTPAPAGHAPVAESTRPAPAADIPRVFAAELVDGLGVVLSLNEDGDFDTPARTRAVAVQARQFADHLDRLADEQQAAADVDTAISTLQAQLDALRAVRRRMVPSI